MKDFFAVGQIINTHGLKGELKVYPLTDDIKRFRRLKDVYINGVIYNVTWCKFQSDKIIMKIEGIDTIEDGLKYKNAYIEVKREDAVKLSEGRYFIADLIGCKVYDEEGILLGIVENVLQTGSNDVYIVKGKDEILVPAIKDIVLSIDVTEEKIIIKALDKWQ
jgi:16S rRNA processing protein RimM